MKNLSESILDSNIKDASKEIHKIVSIVADIIDQKDKEKRDVTLTKLLRRLKNMLDDYVCYPGAAPEKYVEGELCRVHIRIGEFQKSDGIVLTKIVDKDKHVLTISWSRYGYQPNISYKKNLHRNQHLTTFACYYIPTLVFDMIKKYLYKEIQESVNEGILDIEDIEDSAEEFAEMGPIYDTLKKCYDLGGAVDKGMIEDLIERIKIVAGVDPVDPHTVMRRLRKKDNTAIIYHSAYFHKGMGKNTEAVEVRCFIKNPLPFHMVIAKSDSGNWYVSRPCRTNHYQSIPRGTLGSIIFAPHDAWTKELDFPTYL